MRLSFVIPTRNQAGFLRRAIDSCIAQAVADSEIVVMDGASDDGTVDVLRSYGNRIRWRSERDRGQGDAVNKGVALASGEVIAWLNSDDAYAGPGVLGPVMAAFDADPEVDVVFGDGQIVDSGGRRIRAYRNRPFRTALDLLRSPIGLCQPAAFFRRRLFEDAGGIRVDLPFTLDYELTLRLFGKARTVRHLDRTLASTTFHPAAKSIAHMRAQIEELHRVKREHSRRLGLGLLDRSLVAASIAPAWAYWIAVRLGLRRAT